MSAKILLREILKNATTSSLNELLSMAQRLSQEVGDKDLEKWIRLEIGGYHGRNKAVTDDVSVPEYRTVPGQHSDDFGRPLVLSNPQLGFINEHRLREGVSELEHLATSQNTLTIRNPTMIRLIRENFNVDVCIYSFSPASVAAVLSSIRSELISRIYELKSKYGIVVEENDVAGNIRSTPSSITIENFQGIFGNVDSSSVTQNLEMIVKKGNLKSLKDYLASNGVEEHEIKDLKTAIDHDPIPEDSKHLGKNVSAWIVRMIQKAAGGGWEIGIATAGTLLAEAVSGYYGIK